MDANDRVEMVRACYRAYESQSREVLEEALSDDFTFYSPPDPGIDRERYFERCWPNTRRIKGYEFKRLIEIGDEVLATYEVTKADGGRFCNTEIHTFDGDKISRVEVYFGWDLE